MLESQTTSLYIKDFRAFAHDDCNPHNCLSFVHFQAISASLCHFCAYHGVYMLNGFEDTCWRLSLNEAKAVLGFSVPPPPCLLSWLTASTY